MLLQHSKASNRSTTIRLCDEISGRTPWFLLCSQKPIAPPNSFTIYGKSIFFASTRRKPENPDEYGRDSHWLTGYGCWTTSQSNSQSGSTYVTRFAKQKGKSEATCSHYGYPGHLVDKCFQIIGYPPGWKGPKGKRFVATPHANRNYQRLPTAHNTVVSDQHQDTPNIVFSQEQIQNLLTLANSISNSKLNNTAKELSVSGISFSCHTNSSPQNRFTWILDTGATDHMICSPILFESIVLPQTQNQVHLPNGQKVPIAFSGTIKFSPDITLHNALYVPSFNINLISVSKLTADNTIGLFFLHTKCILQDLSK